MDDLRTRLSPAENQALTLRLMDVSWREIGELLGQGSRKTAQLRRNIRDTPQEMGRMAVPERGDNGDK